MSGQYELTGPFQIRTMDMGRAVFPGSMVFWAKDFYRRYELCFQAVLIQGRDRVILLNTGFDSEIAALDQTYQDAFGTSIERGPDQWIHTALHRWGVAAEDVTDLVLTPLGTYSSTRAQDFPAARIWLSKTGWVSFHTWPNHLHDNRETTLSTETLAWLTGPAWPRVRLVDSDAEIVAGVRLWWAGGHHRATMCLEVDTDGPTVVASDIYFYLDNLSTDHPVGMSENIYEVLAAYERIRAGHTVALALMDPQNFDRYPEGLVCRQNSGAIST